MTTGHLTYRPGAGRRRVRAAIPVAVLLVALVVSLAALAPEARAAAYTVGTTQDTPGTCLATAATCSLRQAIDAIDAKPSPPDTIAIPSGSYQLGGTALAITADVQIYGSGLVTIAQTVPSDRTTAGDRVFTVKAPTGGTAPTVGLWALTLTGGTANGTNGYYGGDIFNAGNLTLTDVSLSNGDAGSGGGIVNEGTLTLERSTVANNSAAIGGSDSGGIFNYGGAGAAILNIDNSTIADNTAALFGGISSYGSATNANRIQITNSTIADNSGGARTDVTNAGGLEVDPTTGGSASVQDTILFGNTVSPPTTGPMPSNCHGAITSRGHNLESGTDCGFTATGDKQSAANPFFSGLGLGFYGWLTQTFAVTNPGSAADGVPASGAGCPATDQRGISRPQGTACDIGSEEAQVGTSTAIAEAEGASAVSANAATLNGLVSDVATPGYHFEYGTTTQYGSVVPVPDGPIVCDGCHAVVVNQPITGLAPSTIYHYRLDATNGAGTFSGADQTFITAPGPPASLAPPKISGTPQVGSALTSDNGSFNGTPQLTYTYQWQQCSATGTGCQNITGATAGTYTAQPGDQGHELTVVVTAHNGYGQASGTATPVGPVTAAPITTTSSTSSSGTGQVLGTSTQVGPVATAPPTVATTPAVVSSSTQANFTAQINPHGLPTTMHFEYGLDTTYGSRTPEQTVGTAAGTYTVGIAVSGLLPNSVYHVRAVATSSAGVISGNDVVFTTRADPPPGPPVLGENVNVTPVSGHVFIKLPPGAVLASAAANPWSGLAPAGPAAWAAQAPSPVIKGQGFVPLTEARQIPVGSILDTTAGTVKLTTATATRHKTQAGDFSAGIFALLQNRRQRGLTVLNLVNPHSARQVCATAGKAQAARKVSSKVLDLLKGSDHGGRFSTHGTYAAATVRGTVWSVANQCDGTLTRVTRGVVVVRDLRRHKTITLTAGRSYLARAPGA